MNVLVIGKAKTGTTLLASLIRDAIGATDIILEPKSVLEFGDQLIGNSAPHVVKIIFEHFNARPRHFNAIVHAEFGFALERVVFIRRDIRDEMISRLIYFSKVLSGKGLAAEKWDRWLEFLRTKEARPQDVSFQEMCHEFHAIFDISAWDNIVRAHVRDGARFEAFIGKSVARDKLIVDYEDLVKGDVACLSSYLGRVVPRDVHGVELGRFEYTRRSGRSGNWKQVFTPADVEILRPIINEAFGEAAPTDWQLEPTTSLPAGDYSEYVTRMLGRT